MERSLRKTTVAVIVTVACGRWFASLGNGEETQSQKQKWPHIDQSQYVGSRKCAECHKTYYDSWKDSPHNKMIRRPITEGPDRTVLADFNQPSPERNFDLKDVKWVIGSHWKQRFIGVVNGKEVVFPAQWSIKDQK